MFTALFALALSVALSILSTFAISAALALVAITLQTFASQDGDYSWKQDHPDWYPLDAILRVMHADEQWRDAMVAVLIKHDQKCSAAPTTCATDMVWSRPALTSAQRETLNKALTRVGCSWRAFQEVAAQHNNSTVRFLALDNLLSTVDYEPRLTSKMLKWYEDVSIMPTNTHRGVCSPA